MFQEDVGAKKNITQVRYNSPIISNMTNTISRTLMEFLDGFIRANDNVKSKNCTC